MRTVVADTAIALLAALTLTVWFAAWPSGIPAAVPAIGLVGLLGWRAWELTFGSRIATARLPRPRPETMACLIMLVLYRVPALVHPWGWVNTDGAYGGFVALHLLEGVKPAPVFTEGANYQGTLKGHLGALMAVLTPIDDLSLLIVLAGLSLTAVFLVASMALARRIGGAPAALASGLFIALGPKFLTVFMLNSVGQYADVLALGTAALALLAGLIDAAPAPSDRLRLMAVGALLGAAFWQQPVALSYLIAAAVALAVWRPGGRPSRAWTLLGLAIGVLPVLLWNVRHEWRSGDILGRDPSGLHSQAEALPALVTQTVTVSLPILAGASRGHPWWGPALRLASSALIPLAMAAFLAVTIGTILRSLRARTPSPAMLPPLVTVCCLGLFWAVASGAVYHRPRYLLPVAGALAIHVGVVTAAVFKRSRPAAILLLGALLAVNVAGTVDRLGDGAATTDYYRRVLRSLERKGIRTGYADFSLSAPVTLFTRERILLSSRLGPTPAYEPESHRARVEREGPDAYVLRPDDDPQAFAEVLRGLGVSYRMDVDPVPVFHAFSRRVRVEEVAGFRGEGTTNAAPPDEER